MVATLIELIVNNKWVFAVGTFSFFAIKGLMWLLIPALIVRYKVRAKRKTVEPT